MRSNTTTRLGLILMAAMLAALPAAAQKGERGGGWADEEQMERMHERRLERLTVFLDLNDQQVEQWKAAHASRVATRQGGRDEMRRLHQEIQEMASADKPDAKAVGELVIQAHRLKAEATAEREAFHAELMSILTPEQQERFEAMRELGPEHGRRGRRGHHGGRGLHHGGPGLLQGGPGPQGS